jgi:hypothetical protein
LERLSVPEAAERLGVTQDAVRKRIHRDAIQWEQEEDGRYYVYLDDTEDTTRTTRTNFRTTSQDTSHDNYIEALTFQVALLQRELEDRKEEARRYQHLLAAALERIPALEEAPTTTSSTEPREAPEAVSEERGNGDVPPDEERRSWWRRLFSA